MILRKPYAFFIKHFRLIHFLLGLLVSYSLFRTKEILDFFNEYASSLMNVIGQELVDTYMYGIIYLIPIFIIIVIIVIMGVMIFKKKPFTFYLINIALFIYILIILFLTRDTLLDLQTKLIDARTIRLVRDLITVSFVTQIVSIAIIFVRATGFNIRKFDFKKDLQELKIEESDREEFEVELNIDNNKIKRSIIKQKRLLKYAFRENKLLVVVVIVIVISIIPIGIYYNFKSKQPILNENTYINANGFTFKILNSYVTNTDYKGKVINDEFYYLILKTEMKSSSQVLDMATTKVLIGNYVYTPTLNKRDLLFDFGNIYQDDKVTSDYKIYTLIYQIPKQLIGKEFIFSFVNKNKLGLGSYNDTKIKLKYIDLTKEKDKKINNLDNTIDFSIIKHKVTIKSFDIKKQYKLQYDFCINKECNTSYEYIKPSLTSNYNKAIMKLEGKLEKENINLSGVHDLFDFINYFGSLHYEIGNQAYTQKINLRRATTKKNTNSDIYYIEVLEEVLNASKVSINFKIRNNNYEYILK